MNAAAASRSKYGPQEKKRTTSGSRPSSNSASASSGRGGRRDSLGPWIVGMALLQPQRRAVAPQPALVLLVVGHAAPDQAPEARRVVEHLEVGDLVLDHVVEDLRRGEEQPPVEAHRAVRGAGGPAGA